MFKCKWNFLSPRFTCTTNGNTRYCSLSLISLTGHDKTFTFIWQETFIQSDFIFITTWLHWESNSHPWNSLPIKLLENIANGVRLGQFVKGSSVRQEAGDEDEGKKWTEEVSEEVAAYVRGCLKTDNEWEWRCFLSSRLGLGSVEIH